MKKITQAIFAQLLLISILYSCESIQEQTPTVSGYYNVDSLITASIGERLGTGGEVQVSKEVSIDGEIENKSLTLDKNGLEKELRLFREMDLNELALLYSYDKERDAGMISYRLKNSENQTGIISLKITDEGSSKKIESVFNENNPIYYTNRRLKLTIENGKLDSYEMTGKQKMILKDTIHYSMKGTIN
ncbi:MAG: hypothetical protein WBA74_00515 [Cyclobacteriaceae bacterium]